jgi:hypothetical protein
MVGVLGPLTMDIVWECPLYGLPDPKLCGIQLCLNSVWKEQHSEPAPRCSPAALASSSAGETPRVPARRPPSEVFAGK